MFVTASYWFSLAVAASLLVWLGCDIYMSVWFGSDNIISFWFGYDSVISIWFGCDNVISVWVGCHIIFVWMWQRHHRFCLDVAASYLSSLHVTTSCQLSLGVIVSYWCDIYILLWFGWGASYQFGLDPTGLCRFFCFVLFLCGSVISLLFGCGNVMSV